MKITYIKMLKDKKEAKEKNVLMKHLREKEQKEGNRPKKTFTNSQKTNDFMRKLFENGKQKNIAKKNQVAMFALSLMLVTAGYLNYTNKLKVATLGDAKLVSSQNIAEDESNKNNTSNNSENRNNRNTIRENTNIGAYTDTDKNNIDNNADNSNNDNNSSNIAVDSVNVEEMKTEVTSTKEIDKSYFTETKLQREKMYSQMIETYTKILENSEIPNDQKDIASNEIKNINDRKNQIYTIENLLKTKGIENVVVLTNENNIDVIVDSKENLESQKVAQIQNIVSREMNAKIEDIHITSQST